MFNMAGKVWSSGLRNPYRCSFNIRAPYELYCGDVGEESIEKVTNTVLYTTTICYLSS
jgi:hypothetical protein